MRKLVYFTSHRLLISPFLCREKKINLKGEVSENAVKLTGRGNCFLPQQAAK